MNIIARFTRRYVFGIKDISMLEQAKQDGLKIGRNCDIMGECIIDPGHCWLISIGDNVTLAPRVHILAHDASTFKKTGYTVIGRVVIGNNVFVGASAIILPNVTIGDDVIIGAGSVVTHSIPSNSVAAGNPARVLKSYDDYIAKRREEMTIRPLFDSSFEIDRITPDKKERMKDSLKNGIGFVE